MGSIRSMSALSAKLGIKLHQFDVTSTDLNKELDENIFMEYPSYFAEVLELIKNHNFDKNISRKAANILNSINKGDKVLFLKKSLYDLKQAGSCWNNKLNKILIDFGAKQSSADEVYITLNVKRG